MSKPSYYAIIPAAVRYDKRLKDKAKLLYGEITALCNHTGYCWATNNYFAEIYDISPFTVSRLISNLQDYGYVDVFVDRDDNNKRRIKIKDPLLTKSAIPIDEIVNTPIDEKRNTPIDEIGKYNNTSINTTSINNKGILDLQNEVIDHPDKISFSTWWEKYDYAVVTEQRVLR